MKAADINNQSCSRLLHSLPIITLHSILLIALNISATAASDSTKHWVGTWASAQYEATSNTPSKPLSNNTLRQIVRVSIGGDTVRVKFSNITCSRPVTINSVNIAVSSDGTKSPIDASTKKDLTFNGSAKVTINAKSEVYSDPVAFDLKPSQRIAITVYYGECQSSSDMTFHYGSRTNSYHLTGDKTNSADFSGATAIERWYTIAAIEVLAPETTTAAVAIIGNSITDGYGLNGGLHNRWTDVFSERLLADAATSNVGVLNLGIGATNVTSPGNGAKSGVDRFKQDVLSQSGLRWVIIFYGVNDINASVSANGIIDGYKKMIADANTKDTSIKVYGATITPFNGHSYYSAAHEKVRSDVNKWIRTDSSLDSFIDFDKAIRNPSDATKMQAAYSNDWLHPNVQGYKALGESVDLDLFTIPTNVKEIVAHKTAMAGKIDLNVFNGFTKILFDLPGETFVSLKLYSMLGKEIAELAGSRFSSGSHTVTFNSRNLPKGIYLYSLKANNISVSRVVVY